MSDHVTNRDRIVSALRRELVGPDPQGPALDCNSEVSISDNSQRFSPWRQLGSGEEILQRDSPTKRYGIGILFPSGTETEPEVEMADAGFISPNAAIGDDVETSADSEEPLTESGLKTADEIRHRSAPGASERDSGDLDLSMANSYRPGSMALSFLVDLPDASTLVVDVAGGRYRRKIVEVIGKERTWWLRSSVSITAEFSGAAVRSGAGSLLEPTNRTNEDAEELALGVEVFSRVFGEDGRHRLLTVCLVNRTPTGGVIDERCLFQSGFTARVESADGEARILPYPEGGTELMDDEEQSLAFLYRDAQTYGVGHGCAADWSKPSPETGRTDWVAAESLPSFETPSITPEIRREDGTHIEIPMAPLAGLVAGDDGFESLAELVERYETWIAARRQDLVRLGADQQLIAERHLEECVLCAFRMKAGLEYLGRQPLARRAFQLANHAVLLQQIRAVRTPRGLQYDPKKQLSTFAHEPPSADPLSPPEGRGRWRPFQIAFILMALASTGDGNSAERDTVELLWFPTGGGKTEAYFGLASFAMFLQRLKDPGDVGVNTIMRYTLRLLTAQQFQRASSLICAMEYLRCTGTDGLGETPFSIGIWLGGDTTPNSRQEARAVLRGLQKPERNTENLLLLDRCPWCGAQLGPVTHKGRVPKSAPRVFGYVQQGDAIVFECTDTSCHFRDGLPVYVVDEDIYERRPSLVIGTVDKFAMLAWRPEARALFGISPDGTPVCSPPGLIIQDELHMISGPLGSMVGLYELLIEDLCTDRRDGPQVRPKIVTSTATIRRYKDQINGLFGRNQVVLFPPPALDVSDSYFSSYARDDSGGLQRGRLYVGVHGPGMGSVQTAQVRTFASLLQAPVHLADEERDPWWTLLLFFNSLRELGTTVSLFQSDIPDYLKAIKNRQGIDFADLRRLRMVKELTGRLRGSEVPGAISELEVTCTAGGDGYPVDACLASSIIEVGIDIDRLSLMVIVGQPKTTSQYIQVTGRIGRRWSERPGLVVTIYSPSKPRDRSHFEKFRSYHERLYAQVEPTSLTPFSPPALDRALHAVMTAYVRQRVNEVEVSSPMPVPEDHLGRFRELVMSRISKVDPDELAHAQITFDKRLAEWRNWKRTRWSAAWDSVDPPLLRQAGAYVDPEWRQVSWSTPMSMRNVDAQCEMEITLRYLLAEEDNDA